jgi:hypothetical protein
VFILAELPGVGYDAGLDSEGVLAEAFGFGEFADDVPGLGAGEHGEYFIWREE